MKEANNHCNNCPHDIRGICCWFSYFDGVENFIIFPCEHLSKKTKRCKIYKKRFKVAKWCMDLDTAYMMGALPEACPYVKDYDFEPSIPFKTINYEKFKKTKEMIKNGFEKRRFLANNRSRRTESIRVKT